MGRVFGSIQKHQELFKVKCEEVGVSPEAFFEAILKRIYVLVIDEDGCPDVSDNWHVKARIAALNPNIQFRIFPRDQSYDLLRRDLFRGQR